MAAGDDLTPKQRAFVIAYRETGNGVESARRAGYRGSDQTLRKVASENLTKSNIIEALRVLTPEQKTKIADANEVLEFFTTQMRDVKIEPKDRIKSAELLGKRYRLFGDDGSDGQPKKLKITLRWPDAR